MQHTNSIFSSLKNKWARTVPSKRTPCLLLLQALLVLRVPPNPFQGTPCCSGPHSLVVFGFSSVWKPVCLRVSLLPHVGAENQLAPWVHLQLLKGSKETGAFAQDVYREVTPVSLSLAGRSFLDC